MPTNSRPPETLNRHTTLSSVLPTAPHTGLCPSHASPTPLAAPKRGTACTHTGPPYLLLRYLVHTHRTCHALWMNLPTPLPFPTPTPHTFHAPFVPQPRVRPRARFAILLGQHPPDSAFTSVFCEEPQARCTCPPSTSLFPPPSSTPPSVQFAHARTAPCPACPTPLRHFPPALLSSPPSQNQPLSFPGPDSLYASLRPVISSYLALFVFPRRLPNAQPAAIFRSGTYRLHILCVSTPKHLFHACSPPLERLGRSCFFKPAHNLEVQRAAHGEESGVDQRGGRVAGRMKRAAGCMKQGQPRIGPGVFLRILHHPRRDGVARALLPSGRDHWPGRLAHGLAGRPHPRRQSGARAS